MSDAAAEGCARIIDGQRREGESGDPQVGNAGLHYIVIDAAEEAAEQRMLENQAERSDDN